MSLYIFVLYVLIVTNIYAAILAVKKCRLKIMLISLPVCIIVIPGYIVQMIYYISVSPENLFFMRYFPIASMLLIVYESYVFIADTEDGLNKPVDLTLAFILLAAAAFFSWKIPEGIYYSSIGFKVMYNMHFTAACFAFYGAAVFYIVFILFKNLIGRCSLRNKISFAIYAAAYMVLIAEGIGSMLKVYDGLPNYIISQVFITAANVYALWIKKSN